MIQNAEMVLASSSSFGQNVGTGPFGFLFQPEYLMQLLGSANDLYLGALGLIGIAALWMSHLEGKKASR
jgi:hypothetical protein